MAICSDNPGSGLLADKASATPGPNPDTAVEDPAILADRLIEAQHKLEVALRKLNPPKRHAELTAASEAVQLALDLLAALPDQATQRQPAQALTPLTLLRKK